MNCPEHIQRFEEALCSKNPAGELRRLAVSLRDEGVAQIDLFFLFERFQLSIDGDDPKHDAIVDTMDVIYGGPWAKDQELFPTKLSDDEIEEHREKAS